MLLEAEGAAGGAAGVDDGGGGDGGEQDAQGQGGQDFEEGEGGTGGGWRGAGHGRARYFSVPQAMNLHYYSLFSVISLYFFIARIPIDHAARSSSTLEGTRILLGSKRIMKFGS